MTQTMMYGDGYGLKPLGSVRDVPDGLPSRLAAPGQTRCRETTKLFLLLGTYINNTFGPRYYGKAMNISRR